MFRILLAAMLAAIPTVAMAQSQSPWGSGPPTYVARGAQLPTQYAPVKFTAPSALPAVIAAPTPVIAPLVTPAPNQPTAAPVVAAAPTNSLTGSTLFAVDYTTPVSSEVFAAEAPTLAPMPSVVGSSIPEGVASSTTLDSNWAPVSGCTTCLNHCCYIPKCFWARYEQLFWSVDGGRLPPLVTTGPASTDPAVVGAIGAPGTRVLFGGKDYLDDHRNGYRISVGGWLTDDQVLGIEASYFSLEGDSTRFAANTLRFPVLASSPFTNAVTGQSQRVLIGYPGLVSGSTSATYEQDRLDGFDIFARVLLSNQICGRLDALVGYRQINYSESLVIRKQIIPNPNGVPVVPGTEIQCDDTWNTSSSFHGMALGFNWEVCCGKFFANIRPRATIGQAENIVDRGGYTAIAIPGQATARYPGGTYNLNSNLGRASKKTWTVVPEADFQLGFNVCNQLRVFGGYSFMYLPQVARVGNQIDPLVNTDLIPPVLPTAGPALPGSFVNRNGMWVQGVSLGLEIRY